MRKEKFEKYLEERYERQVKWYSDRSSKNKQYYHWFQWTAIILSAGIPILVVSMQDNWKWITVVLSIALAIVTTALKTFKFQENWVNYRTTAETLKKEKHYYDASIAQYAATEDKEQLFVERVEALISRENTLWLTIHKQNGKEKETNQDS